MEMSKGHSWPPRVMHYVHWVSILALTFSGFYIRYPWTPGYMGTMRTLHFIFMYILGLNWVTRIYWAVFGSERDIQNFLPQAENRGKLVPIVKYYLFLEAEHPSTARYNPLQKATYVFWFFLVFLQGLTGFSLYWPQAPVFSALNDLVGGLLVMHSIHYLIMWIFIITTAVHIYLSLAEDFQAFLNMFFATPYRKS